MSADRPAAPPVATPPRGTRRRRATLLLLAGAVLPLACSEPVRALGESPDSARAAGDQLFYALSARFTNVLRAPKFAAARGKLAHAALSPSRVWDDTSVWTARDATSRTLTLVGRPVGNRYLFDAVPQAAEPERLAASRHVIRLERAGDDWVWDTRVAQAIGSLGAERGGRALGALLSAGEGRSEHVLRTAYATAFPRTTASLGRLFTLDSLRTAGDREGATAVRLAYTMRPDRLRRAMPAFAKYLDKYAVATSYRVVLSDAHGARWVEIAASHGTTRVLLRTRGGALAPLDGPVRPMPDSLRVRVDFVTHVAFFDVGFDSLVGSMVVERAPHERAWAFRFAKEPEWRLPPIVGHLVRAALARPFADGGSTMRVGLRDAAGGQTLLARETRLTVRESALVRWLGGLGNSAMGDFVGPSELEENRFDAEVFAAMQADVRAMGTANTER